MINNWLHSIIEFLLYSAEKPWLFTRLAFWIFFTIVIGLYSLVHRKVRVRNAFLLLVSVFFYYKTGGWFFILLLFSCVFNYGFGFLIGSAKRKTVKVTSLVFGLVVNLFLLFYFKYAFFFTDILNGFTNDAFETYNWLAQWWNVITQSHIDTTEIILPVGISFFTFQAISYLVDVYKGRSEVVRNVFDFSFYLSFFPQLVAGPIVRASSFVPQLYKPYKISQQEFGHALFLILAGLIKKIVISDYLAVNYIDRVFSQPGSFSGIENLVAIYAYAIQIFADFSGYTDIAIGLALLLGFRLPINFNSPYKAVSLTDFWHRWHISLSTWLRDYLYIPLGGNRKGKIRTYVNLLATMVLGGLWHGANMRFVIWGTLHGVGLMVEKAMVPIRKKLPQGKFFKVVFIILTFHLVCIGWLFFRAESMDNVLVMLNQIYYLSSFDALIQFVNAYSSVSMVILFGFVMHFVPQRWQEFVRGRFIRLPVWWKGIIVLVILYFLQTFVLSDIQPFIYFRF